MKISLILPVYKKEDEILKQLIRLENFFNEKNLPYEIIVIIDGIVDSSQRLVRSYMRRVNSKNIILKVLPHNKGKGFSIKQGFSLATGDIIGFMDADLDIQLKTLELAINKIQSNSVKVVFPNKFNNLDNLSRFRKALSISLQRFYTLFLGLDYKIEDISFGLKLFKKEIIADVLYDLKIDSFAIDAEIAYLLAKKNIKINSVNGYLNSKRSQSTTTNFTAIFRIIRDVFRIRFIHSRASVFVLNKLSR